MSCDGNVKSVNECKRVRVCEEERHAIASISIAVALLCATEDRREKRRANLRESAMPSYRQPSKQEGHARCRSPYHTSRDLARKRISKSRRSTACKQMLQREKEISCEHLNCEQEETERARRIF